MAYLTAVPTEDFLKLLKDEALEEVVSYSFIGHATHDNEALITILSASPTLEELQGYIYHTADIDTSYYDSKGIPTFEVMINADESFAEFNYALVLLTKDNKIASYALTPKMVFAEGIGGVLYTKIAINTDGDCNSEIIFKNTDYLTVEELLEVHLKELEHDHPYLPISGKAVDSDKLDGKDSSYFASKVSIGKTAGIAGSSTDSDPNNPTEPYILTKHVNNPDSEYFYYIHTMTYTGFTSETKRLSQMAIRYNGSTTMSYVRHYYEGWTTWTPISNNADKIVSGDVTASTPTPRTSVSYRKCFFIYPPVGYVLTDLIMVTLVPHVINFDKSNSDKLYCHWSLDASNERIIVEVGARNQWANSMAAYNTVWRKR